MAIRKNKITFDLALDLSGIPRDERDLAKESAGEVLLAEIINDLEEGKSSVSGEKFEKLSPAYKKRKLYLFGSGKADLTGTESMRESMRIEMLSGSKIRVIIDDEEEAVKAYNHNVGDTVPKRQFIPNPSESFRQHIIDSVNEALDDYRE